MKGVFWSPIFYPGGKRWLYPILEPYVKDESVIVSPFIGGASLELNWAYNGIKVFGFDSCEMISNFWEKWLEIADVISKSAQEVVVMHKPGTLSYHKHIDLKKGHETERAIYYFIHNRLSYNGIVDPKSPYVKDYKIRDGKVYFTSKRTDTTNVFSQKGKIPLQDYEHLPISVKQADFSEALKLPHLAYCDPPYYKTEGLYGGMFDHLRLAETLYDRDKWILSYNDCKVIRNLYRDYRIKEVSMTTNFRVDNQRPRKTELLIFSNDIEVKR